MLSDRLNIRNTNVSSTDHSEYNLKFTYIMRIRIPLLWMKVKRCWLKISAKIDVMQVMLVLCAMHNEEAESPPSS